MWLIDSSLSSQNLNLQFCSILLILALILFYSLWIFPTGVSWLSFTEIWMTVSLLSCQGLFLVFWPVSKMLYSIWSRFVLRFPILPAFFPSISGLFQACNYKWYYCHPCHPVMLKLWGMRSTPLLPWPPSPLWPGMVESDRALFYGLNRTNYILMLNWIVWIRTVCLKWIARNRTVLDS